MANGAAGSCDHDSSAPLPLWGNTSTYNLEAVIATNVRNSDYFRKMGKLELVTEVIDEIYYRVEHVEPWMTGGARGPSTAFCLLVRLFTIQLSKRDLRDMMEHVDSPYIRCIGFLYARYVLDPRTMWKLLERYLFDEEEFAPGSDGKTTTMGKYVRDLLLARRYFDTLLPRIPLPVEKEMLAAMESEHRISTRPIGNGGVGGYAGDGGSRQPMSVKASLSVSMKQRAPNRVASREAGASGSRASTHYDRDYDREYDRERERGRGRSDWGRHGHSGGGGGGTRDAFRERERSRERYGYRAYDRDRERDRDSDRYPDDNRRRGDGYSGSYPYRDR